MCEEAVAAAGPDFEEGAVAHALLLGEEVNFVCAICHADAHEIDLLLAGKRRVGWGGGPGDGGELEFSCSS